MSLHRAAVLIMGGVLLSRAVVGAPLTGRCVEADRGQAVRLRHLYAARSGLHLGIGPDGGVHGSELQGPHTLMEITAVSPGCVVLRGVSSDRFLCIMQDATLYSSGAYLGGDCTFREQLMADGYSVFSSQLHGQLLSLGSSRQRQRGQDTGLPALAQFLPRLGAPVMPTGAPPTQHRQQPLDPMESLVWMSQIIHSPSFHER